MNQQRLQSYVRLIQDLLACPSGEEWILLRQNEALVTPELVQVMEQVATQLANQGNANEAKFLHNLAGQIHHLFLAQTVQPTNSDDQSQAYLDLIQALLECSKGSEEEVLAAHPDLIGPGLVHMMNQVASRLAVNGEEESAHYLHHWASQLGQLWLQQHDFQPVPKEEAKSTTNRPQPLASVRTENPSAQTSTSHAIAPPGTAILPDEDDLWADPVEQLAQPQFQPSSTPNGSGAQSGAPTALQGTPSTATGPEHSSFDDICRHLEAMAEALIQLRDTLAPNSSSPPNPLWYMEVLERAYSSNWLLTSTEVQQLIGVKPSCSGDQESFQRGCWIFVKAGKLGTQTAWRVQKIMSPILEGQ